MSAHAILRKTLAAWAACVVPLSTAFAGASTHDRLEAIARAYIDTSAQFDPFKATALGITGFDGRLPAPGEAARAARIAQLKSWQSTLAAIRSAAGASMSLVDRDNAMLVGALLVREIDDFDVRQADRRDYAMGRDAYDAMLRDEQLLPYGAADLQRMAQDELAHGWAEEAWLNSLSAYRKLPYGPASGGGMAPSGPALVDYYRERMADLQRFVVDHDLVTIPAWLGSMRVVETPAFMRPVSPGASMVQPRLFSASTTGFYFITPPDSLDEAARRLDMNQDFDRDRILSTAAHEAMPGHFFQLSIARRHPDAVRKIVGSDVFAEGWAFYGEEMFVRLGLYGDGLDARLFTARWERVRGARAVVDPKLATGEWTMAQAVEFFEAQSGFTHEASVEAVQQIAMSPGYFIAYTVGRLQLETLLGDYQRRTGARGSLHDFHDRLLSYGCVPFAVVAPELLADLDRPATEVRAAAGY